MLFTSRQHHHPSFLARLPSPWTVIPLPSPLPAQPFKMAQLPVLSEKDQATLSPGSSHLSVSTLNHIAWVQVGAGSVQPGTWRGPLALVLSGAGDRRSALHEVLRSERPLLSLLLPQSGLSRAQEGSWTISRQHEDFLPFSLEHFQRAAASFLSF